MILGVIPARLNSTRFPNKVIFSLNGKTIVEHVYNKAIQSSLIDKLVVAVDSEKTEKLINCSNIMMTSDKHESGTDRVAEVANNYDCDIVSDWNTGLSGLVDIGQPEAEQNPDHLLDPDFH